MEKARLSRMARSQCGVCADSGRSYREAITACDVLGWFERSRLVGFGRIRLDSVGLLQCGRFRGRGFFRVREEMG